MLLEKRRQFYLDLLSTLKGTITLFRDANKTDSVYDIEDGLRHSKASILAVEFVKSQPEVAQLIQERSPVADILNALVTLSGSAEVRKVRVYWLCDRTTGNYRAL